jgi:hypothetical protein
LSPIGTKLTPWVRRRKGCCRTLSRLRMWTHFGVRAHAREDGNRRASGLLGKPDCTACEGMVAQVVAHCLASIRRSKLPYGGPATVASPSVACAAARAVVPAYRTGRYTAEAKAERRQMRMLTRELRQLKDSSD